MMWKWLRIILELGKARISVLAMLSTVAGYLISTDRLSIHIIGIAAGIFLMACGSCALNQYQERGIDALMERTQHRPIPSGKVTPVVALVISIILLLSGAIILYFGANLIAMSLGLAAAFWYNVVYAYLKKITAFAVIPGALVGAIPPMVGYAAGGNSLLDRQNIALAFFCFIWQVPHFWLLLIKYGVEYEKAGLPSLTKTFSDDQLKKMTFMWVLAMGVACLLTPLFNLVTTMQVLIGLIIVTFWIIIDAFRLLLKKMKKDYSLLFFRDINIYALLVLVLLSADKIIM